MKLNLRLSLAAVLLGISAGLSAQLSLSDRMYLRMQDSMKPASSRSTEIEGKTLAFIKLAEGASRADLEREGVSVSSVRGDIALVSVANAELERIAALPCVERLEISRPMRHTMDRARESAGVDKIHSGVEIDQPYTGKGVIAGIVDDGLDPNHINFRNPDGTSRIGLLSNIELDSGSEDGWTGTTYDKDNIWRFSTDNKGTFHATHTLGILGGSYKGKIKAAVENEDNATATIKEIDNPYYGVATGAELVAGTTVLVDQLIATSVDKLLDYRAYRNMPMVLSLSLGSNINSHSPKALMNQFLDLASLETLIVISAGNEGDIPLAVTKNLSEDDKEVKSFIKSTILQDLEAGDGTVVPAGSRYGMCHIFSDRPFKLKAVTYNIKRKRIAYNMAPDENATPGTGKWFVSSSEWQSTDEDIICSSLGNAFDGYVGVGYDTDNYSKEYMGLVSYFLAPKNDNYIFGFVVEGEPGQRIECYNEIDYGELSNFGIEGWDDGSADGSISDMACGNNVLVVGSYNTRDSYGSLEGLRRHYQGRFTPGKISPFSSWGTLSDGRSLPHVCGPGAAIISSTNSYYEEYYGADKINKAVLTARLDESGRRNYWTPASGTSMSTPYVAGSIACWLEADPTLTMDEVKDIIANTSVRDADVLEGNPVQWGAGKFDAYAGLKEVLRRSSGITNVSANEDGLMLKREGNNIELFLPGADSLKVSIYSTSGQEVIHSEGNGDTLTIDVSSLSPGIYILNVNNSNTRKIIVR